MADNSIELSSPLRYLADIFEDLRFKTSGLTAIYLAVSAICYIIFFDGLPKSIASDLQTQNKHMNRFDNRWYYKLFHTGGRFVEYAARMDIDAKKNDAIRVAGRMTKLWLSKHEDFNCYERQVESTSQMSKYSDSEPEYRWKSDVAAVVDGVLVVIYRFVGAKDDNPGVLFASLLDGETEARWGFYDFSQWRSDEWFINSGFISVFRPNEDSSYESQCRKMINEFSRVAE